MIKQYWRELLIILLIAALAYTGNRFQEVSEVSGIQEVSIIQLKQKLRESKKETESWEETKPDGSVIKHIVIVESNTESETNSTTKRELERYKELLKKSKAMYQWGWTTPIGQALKFKRMSFDAGVRLFDLPVFGVIQYKDGISAGIRLEW